MLDSSLFEVILQLATVVDKATDSVVHEKLARVVKLHAKIAVASAWIPLPGADIAAMAANTWTMYVRINKTLDIPFSENLIKSLAAGIGTNLLSNLPVLGVSGILKLIPGIGTVVGSSLMSASLYPVTIAAGIVYMKALAILLEQQSELTEVNLQAAVDSVTNDKDAVQRIMTEANKEYELAKASGGL